MRGASFASPHLQSTPMTQLLRFRWLVLGCLIITGACRSAEPDTPAVATPSVTLNHDRVPAGSVLEITYKFVVADGAKFDKNYRVFVHFRDADGEYMFGDDHDPSVPTTSWQPGQTVEYTRTVFVPVLPYVGETTVTMGLHAIDPSTAPRPVLSGDHVGQHAYKVARFELAPQTENVFSVFKDGWHQAEVAEHDTFVEWQWTKQDAVLAFRNPKKTATLYLDADSPGSPYDSQEVKVFLGQQEVDAFTLTPKDRVMRKIALPADAMGTGEMSEVRVSVDKTFTPANGQGPDKRVLGIRVFHALVDAR